MALVEAEEPTVLNMMTCHRVIRWSDESKADSTRSRGGGDD